MPSAQRRWRRCVRAWTKGSFWQRLWWFVCPGLTIPGWNWIYSFFHHPPGPNSPLSGFLLADICLSYESLLQAQFLTTTANPLWAKCSTYIISCSPPTVTGSWALWSSPSHLTDKKTEAHRMRNLYRGPEGNSAPLSCQSIHFSQSNLPPCKSHVAWFGPPLPYTLPSVFYYRSKELFPHLILFLFYCYFSLELYRWLG